MFEGVNTMEDFANMLLAKHNQSRAASELNSESKAHYDDEPW